MGERLTRDKLREYLETEVFTSKFTEDPGTQKVGIELELLSFQRNGRHPNALLPASLFGTDPLFGDVVAQAFDPEEVIRKKEIPLRHRESLDIVDTILFDDGDRIRFEPGAQLEIITAPTGSLIDAERRLRRHQKILKEIEANGDYRFIQSGINPWFTEDEVGLQLHFPRYRALEAYLGKTGSFGRQMMMQTASLHLNFDMGSDDDVMMRRYAVAQLLTPFTNVLFANSRIAGRSDTGYASYRSLIWQKLDPLRTGNLPMERLLKHWRKGDLIDAYEQFALNAPLIYLQHKPGEILSIKNTLEKWISRPINGFTPSVSDLENHLSLLFPNARPRGYLEIRSLDCPPLEWQTVPAMFYAGILYNDRTLQNVLELLHQHSMSYTDLVQRSPSGYEYPLFREINVQLTELAMEGCSSLDPTFIHPDQLRSLGLFAEQFPMKGQTFSDEANIKFSQTTN